MARAGEDELIARYFAPLAGPGGLGLRDDAALVAVPHGHELVVTVDAVVAGVHFLARDPPASIAVKALGVNLSDLAAKGAEPIGFVMALALPDDWTETWLAAFAGGLGGMAERCGCALLGGDTVRAAGPLSVSITAFGSVPAGRMVRRTTAKAGDLIAVTGTIGDAALGLDLLTGAPAWAAGLSAEHRGFLEDRYRHPRPRLAFAAPLRENASAAMDVSDGLVGDAAKMLRASGVTGTLDLDRIPLSPAARAALQDRVPAHGAERGVHLSPRGIGRVGVSRAGEGESPSPDNALPPHPDLSPSDLGPARDQHLEVRRSGLPDLRRIGFPAPGSNLERDGSAALRPPGLPPPGLLDRIAGGGDDYEILFTLPPARLDAMTRAAAALGIAVTVLGEVRDGEGPPALRLNGSPHTLATPSFQHFDTPARA